jgi:hypothetical protein
MKEITEIKLAKEKKDFKDKLHLVEKNTLAGFLTVDFSKYLVFPFSHKFAVFTIGQTPNWYLIVAISWAIIGFPAIYAVYKGKKWGAYVLLAFLPICFILYHTFFTLPVYSKIIFYIGIIIFLYLLIRQWKHLK